MRHIIVLSYDGSAFSGWQVQNNAPSVQGALQDALSMLLRTPVSVTGAGRTDAGVNAVNYVAHFDGDFQISDCNALAFRLNAVLPREISVQGIAPASDDFHARFSAIMREYQYFIHSGKDPFIRAYSWHCKYKLDVDRMNRACAFLVGVHDCRCFEKSGSDNATSICNIMYAGWELQKTGIGSPSPLVPTMAHAGEQLVFTVRANRFLRNMVRAIVGTMVDIGRGVREPEYILELLEHGTRSDAGQSVPGNALFLTRIDYLRD